MKNIVNRTLAAKKKLYIQSETKVIYINSHSSVCAGSVRGGTLKYGGEIPIPAEFNPM